MTMSAQPTLASVARHYSHGMQLCVPSGAHNKQRLSPKHKFICNGDAMCFLEVGGEFQNIIYLNN